MYKAKRAAQRPKLVGVSDRGLARSRHVTEQKYPTMNTNMADPTGSIRALNRIYSESRI